MMALGEEEIICPRCGSDNVRRHRYARKWFGWAMFLFGLPLPLPGRSYFCFECSKDFTVERPAERGSDQGT